MKTLFVRTTDGSPPEYRSYDTAAGIAANDIVTITSGVLAQDATGTGMQTVLGLVIGSNVPASTDIIPKSGLDQNATGVNRIGAQGSTTARMSVAVFKTSDVIEIDHVAGAQYANTKVGSTVGIKGSTTAVKSYNDTSYTAIATIVKVITMPTGTVDGRVQISFADSALVG